MYLLLPVTRSFLRGRNEIVACCDCNLFNDQLAFEYSQVSQLFALQHRMVVKVNLVYINVSTRVKIQQTGKTNLSANSPHSVPFYAELIKPLIREVNQLCITFYVFRLRRRLPTYVSPDNCQIILYPVDYDRYDEEANKQHGQNVNR